jgi:carbamoyltransferase
MHNTGYILGISRGHNAGVCLLKDGQIVFSIEEERLTRRKYDGGPLAGILKVLEYTDKVDYIVASHTQALRGPEALSPIVEFTGEDMYTAYARKLGLIDRKANPFDHPQVIDLSKEHHKIHAALAFYNSGFNTAAALIVDGAGSCHYEKDSLLWEVESIFNCSYTDGIQTKFKHFGTRNPTPSANVHNVSLNFINETNNSFEAVITDRAGIVKAYEAATNYCGFDGIEAGKTMGLFPYGIKNSNIPDLFEKPAKFTVTNRNLVVPAYPGSASINKEMYPYLQDGDSNTEIDVTTLQNRRDLAYQVQTETQEAVLKYIIKASEITGQTNVVLCGGYGLNCVANYFYLTELNKRGINFYVEPISNDGGTAIGAALLWYYFISRDTKVRDKNKSIYLGPQYKYSAEEIQATADKYQAEVHSATKEDVVNLMTQKNIVAMFQGRSENGPRALGNRSLMFDPTFPDGKDFVNEIKRREYFRPFAGSILEEDVHEWFDLRGMPNSPHMMYAVNCQPGVEHKIPAIIHVDGTCRIQTVKREENPHYYDVIKAFKEKTGVPIIFNTSFNLGGEPLVETLEDALWTLSQTGIDYLYLPEYNKLITVKVKQQQ